MLFFFIFFDKVEKHKEACKWNIVPLYLILLIARVQISHKQAAKLSQTSVFLTP